MGVRCIQDYLCITCSKHKTALGVFWVEDKVNVVYVIFITLSVHGRSVTARLYHTERLSNITAIMGISKFDDRKVNVINPGWTGLYKYFVYFTDRTTVVPGVQAVQVPSNSTMPLYLYFKTLETGNLISNINIASGTTPTPTPSSKF